MVDNDHSADASYPYAGSRTTTVPANAVAIRNLAMGANYLMSHILHFYHLAALDYVDVNGTGLIPKGFMCPNYDSNYYARGIDPVLQTGGLPTAIGYNGPAYTVNNAPNANGGIPSGACGDLTPYLAGQYVRALKFRRMAQQLGALFTGKMPHASMYTPACVTTKPYDPDPTGVDAKVVEKFHELLYGGPTLVAGDITDYNTGTTTKIHPLNGGTVTMANPHPESIMGFVGKPADFWAWASDTTGSLGAALGCGFSPEFLPIWAGAGASTFGPVAGLLGDGTTNGGWKHGGSYLFDVVAAAHCFPEYFWYGTGYGRMLAWGIFEGADIMGQADNRLITRGRIHVPAIPNGTGAAGAAWNRFPAEHFNSGLLASDPKRFVVKEFTTHSWYNDATGDVNGRHPWLGSSLPNTAKSGAYTFGKAPRYLHDATEVDHNGAGPDQWVPYEVGPLARMMSNADALPKSGGMPAPTAAHVLAVQGGTAGVYAPGILGAVDSVLGTTGLLGPGMKGSPIGVFPGVGANLTGHVVSTLGANVQNGAVVTGSLGDPVFYLPAGSVSGALLNNQYAYDYSGIGTLDRIAARALETYFVGAQMLSWFNSINPSQPSNTPKVFKGGLCLPVSGGGAGLTEAPRGALGHWVRIGKGKKNGTTKQRRDYKNYHHRVSYYQIITPTAWNISPKDHLNVSGPMEKCIENTPLVSESEPIEILRVIHSFDPCCACTVHVMNVKKEKVFEATMEAMI